MLSAPFGARAAPPAALPAVSSLSAVNAQATAVVKHLVSLVDGWAKRTALVADSPQALEPILALRIAVVRMLAPPPGLPLGLPAAPAAAAAGSADKASERRAEGLAGLRSLVSRSHSSMWLRLAKSARAAGHLETAAQALAQAAVHEPYSACLVGAKMAWEAGTPHEAVLRLQQQRKTLASLEPEATLEGSLLPAREIHVKTMLRLAQYLTEQAGDAEDAEISQLHRETVRVCPDRSKQIEKVYYRYACFCDRLLERNLARAKRAEVYSLGRTPGARSSLEKKSVKAIDRQNRAYEAYCKHLPEVMRNYGQSLARGMRHANHALSRLVTAYLEYADLQETCRTAAGNSHAPRPTNADLPHDLFREHVERLPTFQWLPCVAQLVSRSTHRNGKAKDLIHGLLATLLATYPSQLCWTIVPSSLSTIEVRRRQGETIVARAKQNMIGQGRSAEILTTARRIMEALKRVSNDNSMEKREKQVCC